MMIRRRLIFAVPFVLLLAAGFRFAGRGMDAADQSDLARYQAGVSFLRGLTNQPEGLLPEAEQRQLQDLFLQLNYATNYWSQATDSSAPIIKLARRDCGAAVARLSFLLDRSGEVERVWVRPGVRAETHKIERLMPYGSGVLLLRIIRQDLPADAVPRFARSQCDLARNAAASIDIGAAQTTLAAVFFANAPAGTKQVLLRIASGSTELASLDLAVRVPPMGTLNVSVVDESGQPTPAVAGVYASNGQLIVPDTALSFNNAGFYYTGGRVRANLQAHYWPGKPQERKVFFVGGSFALRLPEGNYRLIAGKGTEYLPVTEEVPIKAGNDVSRKIALKRWVDMPARGWYSGDGHVHFAREAPEANQRLMLWTRAEDVHITNVLRMGDARQTYFEQYGFGKPGRYISGSYAIVPGQEDPRTNVIGHTLHLNLQGPVRATDRYYLYDRIFDEVHRQGGLSGYAHVYQPPGSGFFVRRDMTLNIPKNKVYFAEICEFGDIGEQVYYEFLNLGFPLTASAGSDVPWGNTIGTSRVYVYTGKRFDPDAWFAALKAGHTFVTAGPMLEFTVNGQIPGSQIESRAGDVLHLKANAFGGPVKPEYLEIVAQGQVIRSVTRGRLSLDFTIPVRRSTWIAARCSGAHTTPVYVKVDGRRFWNLEQVEPLVARRLEQLKEIEDLTTQEIPISHLGNWDSPEAMKKGAAELRERIQAARVIYQDLLREAKEEAKR